jgi:hypothetical protein
VGAVVALVTAGILAGRALADPLPPLPVPAPTVPAVTVPAVPLPTVPQLPLPANPVPADVGQAAPSAGSVSAPSLGLASSAGGTFSSSPSSPSSPSFSSSSSGGSASSSSTSSNPATVEHLHSSRPWIGTTGPKKRRTTVLTFVLPRAARVVFTVNQVAPVCRGIGRFTVAGHAGLNRVRFSGRVNGKPLEAGTYRISARMRTGRLVRRVTIVVVDGPAPSHAELAAARAANACGESRESAALHASTPTALAKAESAQRSLAPEEATASGPSGGSNSHSGAVLASTVEKAARVIRPVLVALLALSILLLGIAALPRTAVPEPRLSDLLVRHRFEIAAFGAAALVAVAVAFLLD